MPNSDPFFDRIKSSSILPTLPHILLKVIDACNDQASAARDIAATIEKDSSLSAKVMKMVNSVYYGLPAKITSIEQALLLLGTEAVKNVAISAAVFRVFGRVRDDGALNLKVFWRHCLLCATLAKHLAKKTGYPSPDEAFLSGLLHDIGKLVLWINFPEQYEQIFNEANNQSDLFLAAEARLGATHCDVGAWMVGQWHLQSFMADAVLYHHEPVHKILDALPLVKIVHVANLCCRDPIERDQQDRMNTASAVLGVAPADALSLLVQAQDEVNQVAESLGIEIAAPEMPALGPSDDAVAVSLFRSVRNISLLGGTLQSLVSAQGEGAILGVVRTGLQVLFDITHALLFLYDSEKKSLIGTGGLDPAKEALAKELIIPFETTKCLPAAALKKGSAMDSFGHLGPTELSLLDQQLIRLLGMPGILCVPIAAQQQPVGTIVIGLDEGQLKPLCDQMQLLTLFVNQAALALHAHQTRESQLRLIQKERLAASAAMARKVVHEVNNPLSIVKNYVKILGMKLPEQDPAQDDLRIINEELSRAAQILTQLSSFSGPVVGKVEPVDLNQLLSDLTRIVENSLRQDSKIHFALDLSPDLPVVFSAKNRLKQVFLNLLKNAVEALKEGGRIAVRTRALEPEIPEGDSGNGRQVEVAISDDGPGIPREVMSRLFEPFTTTKKDGHAGLGLSIAYGIVKELGGSIACESGDPRGATFRLILPIIAREDG